MIALQSGDSVAEIVPERGALCSRLRLGGRELLFMDAAPLADPQKDVRGGIRVRFPIAGKRPPDPALRQHGFAGNAAWEPTLAGASRRECRLREPPRDGYPWETDALLAFTLSESALRLDFTLHNTGEEKQPFQLGFHPYFAAADKAAARVETQATRALDNRSGAEVTPRLDFSAGELDLRLLDHREPGTIFHCGGKQPVQLSWSPEFSLLVLLTLPGRDFVCVEPWTARSLQLDPGETRSLSFEIAL